MSIETRLTEPTTITTRESLAWTRTFDDYPASEWTLAYVFKGVGIGFSVAATADGDGFSVTVAASVTAKMSAGRYEWQAWATNIDDTSLVRMLASGVVTVKLGFDSSTSAAVDLRSDAKKTLDYINAAISGQANEKVLKYEIATPAGTRRVERMTMSELLAAQKHFAALVANENTRERVRQGGPFMQSIGVNFYDG